MIDTAGHARITKLDRGETMADVRRAQQFELDCGKVVRIVDRRPGLPSKDAIADETGLSTRRVAKCIRAINANETPFSRIDYGLKRAKEGPFAGEVRQGWWPMRRAAYQEVMDQADGHSANVERGVRRSRLERFAFAQGLTTKRAEQVVLDIEERLGVPVEELAETDLPAFEELILEKVS